MAVTTLVATLRSLGFRNPCSVKRIDIDANPRVHDPTGTPENRDDYVAIRCHVRHENFGPSQGYHNGRTELAPFSTGDLGLNQEA